MLEQITRTLSLFFKIETDDKLAQFLLEQAVPSVLLDGFVHIDNSLHMDEAQTDISRETLQPELDALLYTRPDFKPFISRTVRQNCDRFDSIMRHMSKTLQAHGDVVNYVTNINQKRIKDTGDLASCSGAELKARMDELREFIAMSKDADGDTANFGQLSQASVKIHTDALKNVVAALAGETALPADVLAQGLGAGNGSDRILQERVAQARNWVALGINRLLELTGSGASWEWVDFDLIPDSATADGVLKLAKAGELEGKTAGVGSEGAE